MSAPTFPPEHFGEWTLRERRPGCWYLAREDGAEIEVDAGSDFASLVRRAPILQPFARPPLDGIEKLIALRAEFLASLPTLSAPPSIADDPKAPEPGSFEGAQLIGADGHEVSLRSALAKEIEVLIGQWDNDDVTEEAQENDWTLSEFLGDGLASRIEPAAIQREVRNAAVRDALADLRAEFVSHGSASAGKRLAAFHLAIHSLDRLAERFK